MPSSDLPTKNLTRTPQNNFIEAYRVHEHENITVQDGLLKVHEASEEPKGRRQEGEDAFLGQFPWRLEYDP